MKIVRTSRQTGFTIVELLIVVVVIAILAAISVVAYTGVQSRARDSLRVDKVTQIAKAIEMYRVVNGQYPPIHDGGGFESVCGSQTENWGHCNRMNQLAGYLDPFMKIDPTSLSDATQGDYYYYYQSPADDSYQSYGLMVYLEGDSGEGDGGYYATAYEVGQNPKHCTQTYAGTSANWWYRTSPTTRCWGGN